MFSLVIYKTYLIIYFVAGNWRGLFRLIWHLFMKATDHYPYSIKPCVLHTKKMVPTIDQFRWSAATYYWKADRFETLIINLPFKKSNHVKLLLWGILFNYETYLMEKIKIISKISNFAEITFKYCLVMDLSS